MPAPDLPPADELIAAAREAMGPVPTNPGPARDKALAKGRKAASRALDQWAPEIDQLTDLAGAAVFLGRKGPDAIRRNLFRTRTDGSPMWPDADRMFGRSKAWTYRTIVLHQAEAPGRGHPGMSRGPRQPAAAEGT